MPLQPFLIAPLDSGLDTKYDSWLAPNDAVIDGNNYIIRQGHIVKRNGYSLFHDFGNGESIVGILEYIDVQNGKELVIIQAGSTSGTVYKYNTVTQAFTVITGSNIIAGTYDFFNSTVFPSPPSNRLYFVNNASPLQYYDGTNITVPSVTTNGSGATVATAKMVFYYGERIVLLATTENGSLQGQRARWSAIEDPDSWRDDIQGEGGFNDAATGDFIQGAAFIRDTLIVYFEDSVWALRRNPDPLLPFIWDQINDSRECQTEYGVVGYDKFVVGIGKTGIVACDGAGAELIDTKIPFYVAENMNLSRLDQIYGYRYRREEETWWSYPSSNSDDNDSILVLSNEFKAWSKLDLNVITTAIGEHESELDPAWEDFDGVTLPEYQWDDFTNETWLSAFLGTGARLAIAGTTTGLLIQLDETGNDNGDPINFEVVTKEFNPFQQEGSDAYLSYLDLLVDTDPLTNLSIDFRVDSESTAVLTRTTDFLPNIVELVAITNVALTNPCEVTAPQHGLTTGDSIYIYRVEGTVELNNTQYTVTVVDGNTITLDGVDATTYTAYTEGGVITTYPLTGNKVWKRVFGPVSGNFHQLRFYHTESNQPVVIHGIVLWMKPTRGTSL